MSESYNVYYDGENVGTVLLSQQGIYTLLSCTCRKVTGKISRLICVSGDRRESIGVMMPEGTRLVLGKRLTKADIKALGLTPDSSFELYCGEHDRRGEEKESRTPPDSEAQASRMQEDAWQPCLNPPSVFKDPELGDVCKNVRGALIRKNGSESLLAVPLRGDAPFPLMRVFCFGECERIDGRDYLVFTIKNGELVV